MLHVQRLRFGLLKVSARDIFLRGAVGNCTIVEVLSYLQSDRQAGRNSRKQDAFLLARELATKEDVLTL